MNLIAIAWCSQAPRLKHRGSGGRTHSSTEVHYTEPIKRASRIWSVDLSDLRFIKHAEAQIHANSDTCDHFQKRRIYTRLARLTQFPQLLYSLILSVCSHSTLVLLLFYSPDLFYSLLLSWLSTEFMQNNMMFTASQWHKQLILSASPLHTHTKHPVIIASVHTQ